MRSFPQILDGCIEKEKVWMSGSVLKNATFVTPVKSAQFEEMAEATPHASKAAAVLQIEAAELTALSVNPKNGSKTVPFNVCHKARHQSESDAHCPQRRVLFKDSGH